MHSIFSFSRDFLPPSHASLSNCSRLFWYFLIRLRFLVMPAEANVIRVIRETQQERVNKSMRIDSIKGLAFGF